MQEQLQAALRRLDELTHQLQDPAVAADPARYPALMREYKQLEPLAAAWQRLETARRDLEQAEELLREENVYEGQAQTGAGIQPKE